MQRFTSSRRGTLALGVMAALIAAALLLFYIAQYRNGVNSSSSTATVLVANRLIPQNSSGDVVASEKWFTVVQKPNSEVLSGAISDPSSIRGLVATHDIFPDQQLTANDFKTAPTDAVSYNLTGDERAIAIPLDSAHGLTPFIQAGDHVDIIGGFDVIPIGTNGAPVNSGGQARPVLKAIAQDVKVLDVPSGDSSATSSGNNTGNVVVEVTEQQAWDIDFATKNGTVFLAARGQTGATSSRPSLVTLETLLLGVQPIKIYKSFGGRP
jgi:Flp pilus assembly protein CpaB